MAARTDIVVTLYLGTGVEEMEKRFLRPLREAMARTGLGSFLHNGCTLVPPEDAPSPDRPYRHDLVFSVRDFREAIDALKFELTHLNAPEDVHFDSLESGSA